MEAKTLYAVTISQGQYEDTRVWTDSEWTEEENAIKRKVAIEKEVEERIIRQVHCSDCPLNKEYLYLEDGETKLTQEQIDKCLEYCKKNHTFTPVIENKDQGNYIEFVCNKNIKYPDDPVVVSIEKRTDIDNMELLKDGSTVFN